MTAAVDRSDALAQLSEGFCPFCGTAFEEEDDGVYRCWKGMTPESARGRIDWEWSVDEEVVR
jgi:hypothetical protein